MMPRENSGAIFFVQKEKDIIPLLLECPYKSLQAFLSPYNGNALF